MADPIIILARGDTLKFFRPDGDQVRQFGYFELPDVEDERIVALAMAQVEILSEPGSVELRTAQRALPRGREFSGLGELIGGVLEPDVRPPSAVSSSTPPPVPDGSARSSEEVLAVIQAFPRGITRQELLAYTSLDGDQIGTRIQNLVRRGVIVAVAKGRYKATGKATKAVAATRQRAMSDSSGVRPSGSGRPLARRTLHVWQLVKDNPGCTKEELAQKTGMLPSDIRVMLSRNESLFRIDGDRVYVGQWEGPDENRDA